NGATPVGSPTTSSTVNGGLASVNYVLPGNTAPGTYAVVATYNPSNNYTGSSDNTHTLTVNRAGTTTTVANQTAFFGAVNQDVTLSATVTATSGAGAVNEGTVTFQVFNGSTLVGSAVTSGTVSGGAATVTYILPANTAASIYSMVATYNSGTDYTGSSDN